MLTVQKLLNLPPGIFSKGQGLILHLWFNNAKILYNEKGELWIDEHKYGLAASMGYKYVLVNWVAVRGSGYHDWKIYHSLNSNLENSDYLDGRDHLLVTDEQIARHGAKLYDKDKIREFIPCDEESFKLYSY